MRFNPTMSDAREARYQGGSRFFNDQGKLNAATASDALKLIGGLMQGVQNGSVIMRADPETAAAEIATLNDSFRAAHAAGGEAWMETCGQIGAAIFQNGNREGVARQNLVRSSLEQGQMPRVRLKVKDVVAYSYNSDTQLMPQMVRATTIQPEEFQIKGHVIVPYSEIWTSTADLTDEAYQKGFEQITVAEDRYYRKALDGVAGLDNPVHILGSGLTPTSLSSLRNELDTWGLPVGGLWMAADFIQDMTNNSSSWVGAYDPVSQYEIIETGFLGRIYGMPIRSEPFREEKLRVLSRGTLYLVSTPEFHGAVSDRGAVMVSNYDPAQIGIAGRGMFLAEQVSMVIANSRSVVKGSRQ